MILQSIMIIAEDARFEPGTSALEVWCTTNELPTTSPFILLIVIIRLFTTLISYILQQETFRACSDIRILREGSSPATTTTGSGSSSVFRLATTTTPASRLASLSAAFDLADFEDYYDDLFGGENSLEHRLDPNR